MSRPRFQAQEDGKKRRVKVCPSCRAGRACDFAGTRFACDPNAAANAGGAWSFEVATEATPDTTEAPCRACAKPKRKKKVKPRLDKHGAPVAPLNKPIPF